MASDSRTSETDALVCRRLKEARLQMQMTGEEVAIRSDISVQQYSKYETGKNRISAGRLWMLSQILNHDIDWFFAPQDADHIDRRSVRKSRDFFSSLADLGDAELRIMADITGRLAESDASRGE